MAVLILWTLAAVICFVLGTVATYISLACVLIEGHSWDSYSPLLFTAVAWFISGSIIYYVH